MIDTVLFDLDGTLLPMNQDYFVKTYMGLLARTLAPRGYEPKQLVSAVWQGVGAMVRSDPALRNEDAFWACMADIYGPQVRADLPAFDSFYRNEFQLARSAVGFQPAARQVIARLKTAGYRVALATNPIFPQTATYSRLRWAGLEPEDFALVTTYENSCACKPNPVYFRQVLDALNAEPEHCLMVGNDAVEDVAATQIGLPVFLVTDCLICPPEKDISGLPHGGFTALQDYIAAHGAYKI